IGTDNRTVETRMKFQKEELEELKKKQSMLEGENKEVQEEIERLEYYLGKTDIEELRQILLKKQEETEKAEQSCRDMDQKIQEQSEKFQELMKRQEHQKKQLEDQEIWAEEEKRKAQEEAAELERRKTEQEV